MIMAQAFYADFKEYMDYHIYNEVPPLSMEEWLALYKESDFYGITGLQYKVRLKMLPSLYKIHSAC